CACHSSYGEKYKTGESQSSSFFIVSKQFDALHTISGVPLLYVAFPVWDFALEYFTSLHFVFLLYKRSLQINSAVIDR
uniref:Uncharacterized protein n=1 Tax=Castor canadensis TaxID=51338 RepID=A0A8C0ZTP7_CASCN